MDLSAINPLLLLASLMVASTPILLAALGELVVERAGVLNLGVEGMMITGAACGIIFSTLTGNAWLGFAGAALGGLLLSFLFAVLTQILLSNQVATGLALTLFGLGLSALLGQSFAGARPPAFPKLDIPVLSDLPVLGQIAFRHDGMVYVGLLLVLAVWYFLTRTRAGLVLRAVGENHDAAHALGYPVVLIRFGAYISLVRVPQWTEGMTAGAGWIALAIVVFAGWKPLRLLLGAYLFGGVTVLQLNLQAAGLAIPVEYLSMSPYVATIVVLVILAAGRAPGSLGKTFHASR